MVESKRILSAVTGAILHFRPFPFSPGFDIEKVATLAESKPSHSWEFGAASQALLELYNPHLSVFGQFPFPVSTVDQDQAKALEYAASKIIFGEGVNSLSDGDGAVGDPASLGVSAVMLGKTDPAYASAASATIDYIVDSAPRFWNGAISHRVSVPELWADFVYMAPPFMAYYAADQDNQTLLLEAVKQCGLYRQILQDNNTQPYNGVWQHINGPQNRDAGLWSTGNAWAAAGMTRVLATVMKAPVARGTPWRHDAISDLSQWITEILDGAMGSSTDGGLLRNYYDNLDANGSGFGEISGSSLLASVVYRMAILQPQRCGDTYIRWADSIRKVLGGVDDEGNPHITDEGVATPAVNPLNWFDTNPFTTGSPEGQAFVVLMYSAWRDCVLAGRCARSLAPTRRTQKRRLPHGHLHH